MTWSWPIFGLRSLKFKRFHLFRLGITIRSNAITAPQSSASKKHQFQQHSPSTLAITYMHIIWCSQRLILNKGTYRWFNLVSYSFILRYGGCPREIASNIPNLGVEFRVCFSSNTLKRESYRLQLGPAGQALIHSRQAFSIPEIAILWDPGSVNTNNIEMGTADGTVLGWSRKKLIHFQPLLCGYTGLDCLRWWDVLCNVQCTSLLSDSATSKHYSLTSVIRRSFQVISKQWLYDTLFLFFIVMALESMLRC